MHTQTISALILGGERVELREVELWPAGHPAPRTYVYEVWDDRNRLAYAGIADNFERRWMQHKANSWWLGEINVVTVIVDGYRSRHEARQAEACLINEQCSVYNTSKESRMYKEWRGFWEDPFRPTDDWDCVPVTRRYYRWVR